jgi:hypothetical protein
MPSIYFGKWFGLWGLEFFCELVGLDNILAVARFGKSEMHRRRTTTEILNCVQNDGREFWGKRPGGMLPGRGNASHVYLARRDSVRARGR